MLKIWGTPTFLFCLELPKMARMLTRNLSVFLGGANGGPRFPFGPSPHKVCPRVRCPGGIAGGERGPPFAFTTFSW